MVAELLTRVHVRNVHFNEAGAIAYFCQRIPQSNGGVGKATGVDNHGGAIVGSLMHYVDKLALVIGLAEDELHLVTGERAQALLHIRQCRRAVDLRLALSQPVQVWPVEHINLHVTLLVYCVGRVSSVYA